MKTVPFCFLALIIGGALFANTPAKLEKKLEAQWKQYEVARTFAIHKWRTAHALPTRKEWDEIFLHPAALTSAELRSLKELQKKNAQKAQRENVKASVLKIELLRKKPLAETERFCAEFPKGGMLHIHPLGTLNEKSVASILEKGDPEIHPAVLAESIKSLLYPADLAVLNRLHKQYGETVKYSKLSAEDRKAFQKFFFLPEGPHAFPRFQAIFSFMIQVILSNPTFNAWPQLYEDFFRRAQAQGVSYVEFTEILTPQAPDGSSWENWVAATEKRFGITVNMINAFFRIDTPSDLEKKATALFTSQPAAAWVGVNIVADETHLPALESTGALYIPLMASPPNVVERFRRTSHAGELGDVRDIRDSLIFGAERIGHGVLLQNDPVTMEYMARKHVPLEANLVSNLRLGGTKSIAVHPFLFYLRQGIPVSLSTDDEGIFDTDINNECVQAVRETDMNYFELKNMARNSLTTSFASAEVKARLEKQWNDKTQAFEKTWGPLLSR